MRWLLLLSVLTAGFCIDVSAYEYEDVDDCGLEYVHSGMISGYLACYRSLLRLVTSVDYRSELESLKTNGTLRTRLTEIHNQAMLEPSKCNEKLDKSLFTCVPTKLIYIQNVYLEIVEYMFANNSQRTAAFIEGGGFKCFSKNEFAKCFTTSQENPPPGVLRFGFDCEFQNITKSCIRNLISKECPSAAPYISDIIEIMRSRFCIDEENLRSKREILEISKHVLLSLAPLRKRMPREIGGASSKLPHIEKKIKFLCNDSSDVIESIRKMKLCLSTKPMFQTPKDEFIQHIDTCSKDTRKVLQKCLPEKLRYFPDFFFSLVESVVRLVYDDVGEIARGLSPCMPKLEEEASIAVYEDCLKTAGADFQDSVLESKKAFCDEFLEASECFITQLNDVCTENEDLTKFKKDYMEAMRRPCK